MVQFIRLFGRFSNRVFLLLGMGLLLSLLLPTQASAVKGVLELTIIDNKTGKAVPARIVVRRRNGRLQHVRRTLSTSVGNVIDRMHELSFSKGTYRFQLARGPEYRLIEGHFAMERTSLDQKELELRRMVDMRHEGWWSGDVSVVAAEPFLETLMASEDLHFAGALPGAPPVRLRLKPKPRKDEKANHKETLPWNPVLIRNDLAAIGEGLICIGVDPKAPPFDRPPESRASASDIAMAFQSGAEAIVVENPFAWDLPIWLASEKIRGLFLLGDWLRLDRSVESIPNGRPPSTVTIRSKQGPGRWAERIYRNVLEAGLQIAPLAGSGSKLRNHPVGYCRTYVIGPHGSHQDSIGSTTSNSALKPLTSKQWWTGALQGRSVVTNGPMLRPTLGGQVPGHIFQASQGEVLELQVELQLAVRDPVDYLEVLHNGNVVYNARLKKFVESKGRIPPLRIESSGWVMVRVVTGFKDHLRAAYSAPWYIVFDGQPRVSKQAVRFFQKWLRERETMLAKLPADQLRPYIPLVRAARAFWKRQSENANAP